MKIIIDMNLSPEWVPALVAFGYEAQHWSFVGSAGAKDSEIMEWARQNGCVVLTHDLDFGALLAASGADRPSVLQIRALDPMPSEIAPLVLDALRQFEPELTTGALVSVDAKRSRARILPLVR